MGTTVQTMYNRTFAKQGKNMSKELIQLCGFCFAWMLVLMWLMNCISVIAEEGRSSRMDNVKVLVYGVLVVLVTLGGIAYVDPGF